MRFVQPPELPSITKFYCMGCGASQMISDEEMALAKFKNVLCARCHHPNPIASMPLGAK